MSIDTSSSIERYRSIYRLAANDVMNTASSENESNETISQLRNIIILKIRSQNIIRTINENACYGIPQYESDVYDFYLKNDRLLCAVRKVTTNSIVDPIASIEAKWKYISREGHCNIYSIQRYKALLVNPNMKKCYQKIFADVVDALNEDAYSLHNPSPESIKQWEAQKYDDMPFHEKIICKSIDTILWMLGYNDKAIPQLTQAEYDARRKAFVSAANE